MAGRLTCALALLLVLGGLRPLSPTQPLGQADANDRWLHDMRGDGLALSAREVQEIERTPWTLPGRKEQIAERYDEVLERIQTRRIELAVRYAAMDKGAVQARRALEQEALAFVELAARELLFPLWAGGTWSMNGAAARPQSGPVACGWYVQRIMDQLGFAVRPADGQQIAWLASDEQVWSWSGRFSERVEGGVEALRDAIEGAGPGLSILGISSLRGHVLFVLNRGDGWLTLHHSGPSFDHAWVTYDDFGAYLRHFSPRIVHWTKLDSGFIRRWLQGRQILPMKTRRHRRGESPPARVVLAQRRLERAGYEVGPVDGVYGRSTREALFAFQSRQGLAPTGLPDDATLRALASP